MGEPEWIAKSVVLALHEEQLSEHGGQAGLRDAALLDSALDRPRNQDANASPDVFDFAAAYAFGIARNHPFFNGNKRTSLVASEGFLLINSYEVTASEALKVPVWLSLAKGDITEAEIAEWFRTNSIPTA